MNVPACVHEYDIVVAAVYINYKIETRNIILKRGEQHFKYPLYKECDVFMMAHEFSCPNLSVWASRFHHHRLSHFFKINLAEYSINRRDCLHTTCSSHAGHESALYFCVARLVSREKNHPKVGISRRSRLSEGSGTYLDRGHGPQGRGQISTSLMTFHEHHSLFRQVFYEMVHLFTK